MQALPQAAQEGFAAKQSRDSRKPAFSGSALSKAVALKQSRDSRKMWTRSASTLYASSSRSNQEIVERLYDIFDYAQSRIRSNQEIVESVFTK